MPSWFLHIAGLLAPKRTPVSCLCPYSNNEMRQWNIIYLGTNIYLGTRVALPVRDGFWQEPGLLKVHSQLSELDFLCNQCYSPTLCSLYEPQCQDCIY